MSRNVTTSFRRSAEASFADEVDLVFLTISHPSLAEDIRVNWDTRDWILDGHNYVGFPFDITILSDNENPPTAQLAIQNIDPRIGDSIRALTSPPRLKIVISYSGAPIGGTALTDEFGDPILDEFGDPILEESGLKSSDAIYIADKLFLINVSVDIMQVTGTITGWDYLQRVWPGPRAMQQTFPGLFR